MRRPTLLALTVLLSAPALAWVPKLEETVAKNVIDGAYGRRDPVPTFQTLDLSVQGGQFAAGQGAVRVFDGGDACLTGWLAAPTDYRGGSRPAAVTVSGQADQLYFQAVEARDNFRNLSVKDALDAFNAGFLPNAVGNTSVTAVATSQTTQTGNTTTSTTTVTSAPTGPARSPALPAGQLRVDVQVRGLPSEKARSAYLVRLRAPAVPTAGQGASPTTPAPSTTGAAVTPPASAAPAQPQGTPAQPRVIAPLRSSYVNDFKREADGTWTGTLVYYFEPLKAGIGASDRVELLLRTEADTNCAYSVTLDLGSFQ
ncbi:hypothetical protein [Deinococcus planocerae]|uniref:hypothetical protein n=1 Tax=Deinococcus planocerae TaxID=1737569 RepID=UPI001FE6F336|nr:hypothetical protein [Deinococcus planocerae]